MRRPPFLKFPNFHGTVVISKIYLRRLEDLVVYRKLCRLHGQMRPRINCRGRTVKEELTNDDAGCPDHMKAEQNETAPDVPGAESAENEEGKRPTLYLWFDTEFTSLIFEEAALLQAALVATDVALNRVLSAREDICLTVRLAPGTALSPWAEEYLAELIERCRSPVAVPVGEADARLADYAKRAMAAAGVSPDSPPILAGNSVHADWWIARRLLPAFSGKLHYRHLDVTSLKLAWLARNQAAFAKDDPAAIKAWFPEARLDGCSSHDAYFDVQASIAEMAFYQSRLFRED